MYDVCVEQAQEVEGKNQLKRTYIAVVLYLLVTSLLFSTYIEENQKRTN